MGHNRKQSDERILHNNNNHSHIHSVVQPGLHRHQERPTDGEEVGDGRVEREDAPPAAATAAITRSMSGGEEAAETGRGSQRNRMVSDGGGRERWW